MRYPNIFNPTICSLGMATNPQVSYKLEVYRLNKAHREQYTLTLSHDAIKCLVNWTRTLCSWSVGTIQFVTQATTYPTTLLRSIPWSSFSPCGYRRHHLEYCSLLWPWYPGLHQRAARKHTEAAYIAILPKTHAKSKCEKKKYWLSKWNLYQSDNDYTTRLQKVFNNRAYSYSTFHSQSTRFQNYIFANYFTTSELLRNEHIFQPLIDPTLILLIGELVVRTGRVVSWDSCMVSLTFSATTKGYLACGSRERLTFSVQALFQYFLVSAASSRKGNTSTSASWANSVWLSFCTIMFRAELLLTAMRII